MVTAKYKGQFRVTLMWADNVVKCDQPTDPLIDTSGVGHKWCLDQYAFWQRRIHDYNYKLGKPRCKEKTIKCGWTGADKCQPDIEKCYKPPVVPAVVIKPVKPKVDPKKPVKPTPPPPPGPPKPMTPEEQIVKRKKEGMKLGIKSKLELILDRL